jgi:hypothetical protein
LLQASTTGVHHPVLIRLDKVLEKYNVPAFQQLIKLHARRHEYGSLFSPPPKLESVEGMQIDVEATAVALGVDEALLCQVISRLQKREEAQEKSVREL